MKKTRRRTRNLTILAIGALLVIYLAALVGFAWLGQGRLRESLLEQAQLDTDKRAEKVAYEVSNIRKSVRDLSEDRSIQGFLANRDLGMSMDYGLGASLTGLTDEVRTLIATSQVDGQPLFRRISVFDAQGKTLVDEGQGKPEGSKPTHALNQKHLEQMVIVRHAHGGQSVQFDIPVIYKGQAEGYFHVEVDVVPLLRPTVLSDTRGTAGNRIALVDDGDRVIISNGSRDWIGWREEVDRNNLAFVTSPVGTTGWRIVNLQYGQLDQGIITSPLFLAALVLMGMPLIAGLVHVWRLNNHNLVLRTQFSSGNRQRALLRKQNERLQREIDMRLESEEKLAHQANFDQLTGLPNRHLALDRLAQAVKAARRESDGVLILFLDLDRFKQVNDSLGHAAGDELLREAAQRLKACLRDSDTVARLGGDEFLVICPDMPSDSHSDQLAQALLKTLSDPFYIGEHEFFVGASIGVATYPAGGTEPLKLLKNADIAMYAAKEQGRNRFCFYDPTMDAVATQRMKLERNLRHALERNELHLEFQPIVDLSSSNTVAVEALLRWENEELGKVSPDEFIPIAEETGLIHEIGEWVLHEACSTVGSLGVDPDFRVAVNLSSRQFSNPARLLDCVLDSLRESGLMPNQLELEITESILIDDRPEISDLINQLDRIGIRLSIDDFGTGYSALNYLQRFPFDVLKIDRGFTTQVPDSEANATLIRAIIAMAHALDLEVVAEGIETRAQAGFLLVYRCEYGQGYLYSKPLTVEQLHQHMYAARLSNA